MFNQLLASRKITKTAIKDALRRMKKSGITKPELAAFLGEILAGKNKSNLSFCTDEEALIINSVLCKVLVQGGHKNLYSLIEDRYIKRLSKKRWPWISMPNILTGVYARVRRELMYG